MCVCARVCVRACVRQSELVSEDPCAHDIGRCEGQNAWDEEGLPLQTQDVQKDGHGSHSKRSVSSYPFQNKSVPRTYLTYELTENIHLHLRVRGIQRTLAASLEQIERLDPAPGTPVCASKSPHAPRTALGPLVQGRGLLLERASSSRDFANWK